MKKTLILLMLLLCTQSLFAKAVTYDHAPEGWEVDYKVAYKKARKEKKLLLVKFTGSNWCGYCKVLQKEIFDTEEFKSFSDKNLVLLYIDFPRGSRTSPKAYKKQNDKLASRYEFGGYPTVFIMKPKSKSKVLYTTGYKKVSPADYIKDLQKNVKGLDKK